MNSHYELLGIPRDHPQHLIPQAFRNRAREVHPDKATSEEAQERYKDQTVRLIEAYRTLNDPAMRQEYDARLKAEDREGAVSSNRHFHETSLQEGESGW